MLPSPPWADLPPELLAAIGDLLPLRCRLRFRAVCAAWRAALLPVPSPWLLLPLPAAADDAGTSSWCAAFSLPGKQLTGQLPSSLDGHRCVGANGRWLALAVGAPPAALVALLNPLTGERILLPCLSLGEPVSKVAFTPNPTRHHHEAMAICENGGKIISAAAGDKTWGRVEAAGMFPSDVYVDVAHDGRRFHVLTRYGCVYHTGMLPMDEETPGEGEEEYTNVFSFWRDIFPRSCVICELVEEAEKRLAFCGGELYQIWHAGGGERVFVLRCVETSWEMAADLRGWAVFVGMSNAFALRPAAEGAGPPAVRGNCVYWIGSGAAEARGMVFDMETGRAAPCVPPTAAGLPSSSWSPICWYNM